MQGVNNISKINEMLLWQIPGHLVWKDLKSVFLGCNQNLAQLVGFKSIDKFIGKTDFDLPCGAAENASKFIIQDQKAMYGGSNNILDIHKYADENIYCFLTERVPLTNLEGKVVGVICHMARIDNSLLVEISRIMPKLSMKNGFLGSYELGGIYNRYNLSRREEETLFYLLRGQTAKEIAVSLSISPRTVESYIENLKNKFKCYTKSELIFTCIEKGFINTIPCSLISGTSLQGKKNIASLLDF